MAESRKERLEKKRTIRKNKILVNGTGTTDNAIDDQRQRTHE